MWSPAFLPNLINNLLMFSVTCYIFTIKDSRLISWRIWNLPWDLSWINSPFFDTLAAIIISVRDGKYTLYLLPAHFSESTAGITNWTRCVFSWTGTESQSHFEHIERAMILIELEQCIGENPLAISLHHLTCYLSWTCECVNVLVVICASPVCSIKQNIHM